MANGGKGRPKRKVTSNRVVNKGDFVLIARSWDSGEETYMKKPSLSGFFVGTHLIKASTGTFLIHEDTYLDKEKIGNTDTLVISTASYVDIAGKMEYHLIGVNNTKKSKPTKIVWK